MIRSLFNTVDLVDFIIYRICDKECHFDTIAVLFYGCHASGRQRLFNTEHLDVLSAGPISHCSLQW